MMERRQLLYLSRLAADTSPACVAEIVRAARRRNATEGISSLLVFDGWRFCQYIEGAGAAVGELADRLCLDARHTDVKVLHQGRSAHSLALEGHSLLYALNYDDSLDRFNQIGGAAAVNLLAGMLPSFDMEPEFPCL